MPRNIKYIQEIVVDDILFYLAKRGFKKKLGYVGNYFVKIVPSVIFDNVKQDLEIEVSLPRNSEEEFRVLLKDSRGITRFGGEVSINQVASMIDKAFEILKNRDTLYRSKKESFDNIVTLCNSIEVPQEIDEKRKKKKHKKRKPRKGIMGFPYLGHYGSHDDDDDAGDGDGGDGGGE